jgi:hypothetical protein
MEAKDEYVIPVDVEIALQAYPITKKEFSVALLKMRYDRMDDKTQRRAEKTLQSLKDGRFWQ